MTTADVKRLGWDGIDILLVTGDGYVDHPSFAAALLGRWLVAHGYRVGVVAQPDWESPADIERMGRPSLFAGVTAGALDSMLAHYTAFRKKRSDDAYTPGGQAGARPNRATIVYTNLVRRAFPGLPVILGGIEASLRRISHYDFWTDKLRRPLLLDSKADAIIYGMGERAMLEAAVALDGNGYAAAPADRRDLPPLWTVFASIRGIATAVPADFAPQEENVIQLPSHEAIEKDARLLLDATIQLEKQVHAQSAAAMQPVANRNILLTPPAMPLTEEQMDRLYSLPFARTTHPSYSEPIPATDMMLTSVTTHRGCGGGCSFCSLALHQGRHIASRSRKSILNEVRNMTTRPDWKGTISDVGGPSANMWQAHCSADVSRCKRSSCMYPTVCKAFKSDQPAAIDLLRTIRSLEKVRHVRVASGVRYDLALKNDVALRAYTMEFTGGQLKVAPEHICDSVLERMRKPGLAAFEAFLNAFAEFSRQAGKEQYVIPYLMSAFPGCTDDDMRTLGNWLQQRGWKPQQVQCFIPTPGTVATAMYYAEADIDGNPIYVAKTDAERLRQHHILMPTRGTPARNQQSKGKQPKGKHSARPEARTEGKAKHKPSGKSERQPAAGARRDDRTNKGKTEQKAHSKKGHLQHGKSVENAKCRTGSAKRR
ncbi:YgiQ family radical SAM protein [Oleidesulfovibrio sp.]|uniref:YgiQ family radical SAM protein n=1 Tax=Oleidesulfovibrio sp. TaxID=2909707 RepID=UPI003A85949C